MKITLTFKEFSRYANKRACDGCWTIEMFDIVRTIYSELKDIKNPKKKEERFQQVVHQLKDQGLNVAEKMNQCNESYLSIYDTYVLAPKNEEKVGFFKKIFGGKKNG